MWGIFSKSNFDYSKKANSWRNKAEQSKLMSTSNCGLLLQIENAKKSTKNIRKSVHFGRTYNMNILRMFLRKESVTLSDAVLHKRIFFSV